jgi:hypothetical protein
MPRRSTLSRCPAAPRCPAVLQGHILEKLEDPEEVQRMLHALRSRSHFGETMADRIVRETLEARAVGGATAVLATPAACMYIKQCMMPCPQLLGSRCAPGQQGGAVLAVGTAA